MGKARLVSLGHGWSEASFQEIVGAVKGSKKELYASSSPISVQAQRES